MYMYKADSVQSSLGWPNPNFSHIERSIVTRSCIQPPNETILNSVTYS